MERYDDTLYKKLSLVSAQSKKVIQMDRRYNIVDVFESDSEAQRTTRINNISNCCNGKYKTAGGYVWRYVNDVESLAN